MLETQVTDRRRVLLVEDNAGVAELVMVSCKAEGFDIEWKQSADASLVRAIDPGLDMILLDRGLPDGDGVAFLKELRSIGIKTPVILISASVCQCRVKTPQIGRLKIPQVADRWLAS